MVHIDQKINRGKLKIFFGYAAGVGKTYAMLTEARELGDQGVSVLVGYIEPHTRPDTLRLLEGLPQLEPLPVRHKNILLREFDLEGALKANPDLILVDELAHTNADGMRNLKRYQDIEELLSAGIDVYTTVNVQHIESLNNIVEDFTNVAVRETIPDHVFDHAEQVKFIDIEPEELLRRFEAGSVYKPERADAAMRGFFTIENLHSLREIAMRKAADRVSHENPGKHQLHAAKATVKILVCVSSSPSSAKCIRRASRIADSLFAKWIAVHVDNSDPDSLPSEQQRQISANLQLAESLGAEIVTLSGVDVPNVIGEYAKISDITNIVIGKSKEKRLFHRDFEDELLSLLPTVEIHIVPDIKHRDTRSKKVYLHHSLHLSWQDAAKTLLITALASALSYALFALDIGDQNVIMVYILAVLIVSRVTKGYLYGVISSVLNVLTFNFLFTDPYFSFHAIQTGYPVTFIIMLLVALITSTLTGRIKKQARLAAERERRTEILYEINKKLLVTRGLDSIVAVSNEYLVKLFDRSVIFYTVDDEKEPGTVTAKEGETAGLLSSPDERAVARWVFVNQKQAGSGTDTLMGAGAFYIPLVSQGRTLGVLGLSCEHGKLSQHSRFFLQMIASQIAMALERQNLSDEQREIIVESEKEKMRSNLLRAISHDLRTPLTGIHGTCSTILDNDEHIDRTTRNEMLTHIRNDSSWLIRMVENLLTITRISDESGGRLEKTPEAVEEILSEAISRIQSRFPARRIEARVPDELIVVSMDGMLIEQVLINLIENALKHSPPDALVEADAEVTDRNLWFHITDHGAGIEKEDLPHLFDGYFKSGRPDADSSRGIGIGLSICKSIIEAHGGSITAANAESGGARFSFCIPTEEGDTL